MDNSSLLRERVPRMPIIILKTRPDPAGNLIDIQRFMMGSENVTPIFSSEDAVVAAFPTGTRGHPTYAISREYLAQKVHDDEVFLLDARLPTELRFTGAEFRRAVLSPEL